MSDSAEVVVCGAGIAGAAAAYHLAVGHGVRDLVFLDERPPLTLTSDKSTECYRDWWPDPAMARLMARSIDWLERWTEESGNAFALSRNGYLYLTADRARAAAMESSARAIAAATGAPLRVHRGDARDPTYVEPSWDRWHRGPTGADLLLDAADLRRRFPFLAGDAVAALHTRRCGWLSAQQLGVWLLERARDAGARLETGTVRGLATDARGVAAVEVGSGGAARRIATRRFVLAAGPLSPGLARRCGCYLPAVNELHCKVFFDDHLGVVPRELPLVIWNDPIAIDWSAEERAGLAEDPDLAYLLEPLPGGVHFRPEGGAGSRSLLLLWAYHTPAVEPVFPPRFDPLHLQVVLRGVARMVPGFAVYLDRGRVPYVDGGYYCKTKENRPLVGPLALEGAYAIAALSGFGIMAAAAAGELLAAHVTGGELPEYAKDFHPNRYADPGYENTLTADGGEL
jgi:glycine/D-amino acid oxidase-like deaminating enzyme